MTKKIFMAVIALMMTLGAQAQFYLLLKNGEILEADSISTVPPVPGTIWGRFSVSDTLKVQFSQGNLQYQASTNTWRFAENQYDRIGEANTSISSTYDGWIDLFGWGTGDNPTNTSSSYFDYQTFTDWGTNPISNGGNTPNTWRTLTNDEWKYLFFGRKNAAKLFGLCTVNDIKGIILLPDIWVLPEGASFTPSTEKGMGAYEDENKYISGTAGLDDAFTHNTYTIAQWEDLEAAGAVFLPVTGGRYNIRMEVYYLEDGYYWTATPLEDYSIYAYYFHFNSSSVDLNRNMGSESGMSVRLVR